jgi:catechol 2,3-dioxygenase-like lactoylglutathione lyase family enzyme
MGRRCRSATGDVLNSASIGNPTASLASTSMDSKRRAVSVVPSVETEEQHPLGGSESMNVLFIASVSVVVADPPKSRELFVDALGLPLEANEGDDYFHSEQIGGSRHFGIWPLAQAAQACFGANVWPSDRPAPQVSIEFEVEDATAVAAAAEELKGKGFQLLHDAREEPWGQTVARLLSIEGSTSGSRTHHGFTTEHEPNRPELR